MNRGDGTFDEPVTFSRSGINVAVRDFDGDGDADLAMSKAQNLLIVRTNDGSGGFGPQQVITTAAAGAIAVYSADLDGDGDADVLSASSEDNKVIVPDVLASSLYDNKIVWHDNRYLNFFGLEQVIKVGPMSGRSNVSWVLEKHGVEPTEDRVRGVLELAKKTPRLLTDEEVIAAAGG